MTYTAVYDRPALVRGDTLLGWSVEITQDELPASISSARSQLRTSRDTLFFENVVTVVANIVSIEQVEPEVTATWPPGVYYYDLEVTLDSGRVVTWLKGSQTVLMDRTY
jgi:hypothetical protein